MITNEVVEYDEPVEISPQQSKRYTSKIIDHKIFQVRMRQLLQRIDNVFFDKRINEITTKAMREMSEKYSQKENPVFTNEMIHFLSDRISKEFVLSFQHRLFRK